MNEIFAREAKYGKYRSLILQLIGFFYQIRICFIERSLNCEYLRNLFYLSKNKKVIKRFSMKFNKVKLFEKKSK